MGWIETREQRQMDMEYERLNERDRKVSVIEMQRNFYRDRETMYAENSKFPFLLSRLYEEVEELKNAPTNHLGLEKHQEQELCDIILFSLAALDALMGDADEALREKVSKNTIKYPPSLFVQGIPFALGVSTSRSEAERTKLDQEFYG